tara:strand:- start:381 stop:2993 length:2613 start_codon:yes stop_codon:yes gene_type:complete
MPEYKCELCGKEFKQKGDYDKHKKNKRPCVSQEVIEKRVLQNVETNNFTVTLTTMLKSCLDILRDAEGITGDKALRNLSYLLILKLIEPKLDEMNIYNYTYDFSDIEDEYIEPTKKKTLEIVKFTNLIDEPPGNLLENLKYLWTYILSQHPLTEKIFLKDKYFDINKSSTFVKLFEKLKIVNLNGIDCDILGNSYEEVIKDVMIGKTLGQFFTQPLIKNMMVKLINPQIHADGKIETCADPAMGTGGFLITYLQEILLKAKAKKINPDWEFIRKSGLYGKEIEPDTYQLAMSNMLISSGNIFTNLEKGDSIRDGPPQNKFDNILANPPFGIKGLKYNEFVFPNKDEFIPIKTDSAVPLFIQSIIYMLKIGGKCAVVLPEGQDLFSKTNKALISVREYLLKTSNLKEIISLPSGVFTHTSIKTCVFYFVKKKEGADVLNTQIKTSKTQKETSRKYNFSKTHQTSKIKFYDYNPYEDIKNLLVEVPIEDIMNNSYSLNYAEYIKDETEEEQYEEGIVVKTLGEICEFKNGKNITKSELVEGEYPVIGGGQKPLGYHNKYNVNENTIIISKDGAYAGYISKYDTKAFVSNHGIYIDCFNENVLKDYIYYYLKLSLQDKLYKLQTGAAQPGIKKENVGKLQVPIPSLEKQKEIVEYLDFIYEKTNKTSNEKIAELNKLNEFCLNNQTRFGDNEVKTLGEICEVNQGTYIKPEMKIQGEYPVYGGGKASYHINQYNREDEIIVAKDGVSAECVRYEKNKFFLNHHGWTIICKDSIIKKYMFYYLQSIQNELLSIAKGTAQLGINQQNFYKLKIPIPSLEKQKEIVEYCEYNDTLIKQLEKEIENNKKQAHEFITGIVKALEIQDIPEETTDISAV